MDDEMKNFEYLTDLLAHEEDSERRIQYKDVLVSVHQDALAEIARLRAADRQAIIEEQERDLKTAWGLAHRCSELTLEARAECTELAEELDEIERLRAALTDIDYAHDQMVENEASRMMASIAREALKGGA